ncbi:MAG TPA: 4Fe-4S dicluster domain-containing protein, partial [Anaerolineales bacterium]|nr:4Fe-4S dicluster domain-containing protein [Anaerolineales bacterium]
GQGLCRKNTGVMCPSFQATREEMHSTRGRANLLRALITHPTSLRGANEVRDEAISPLNRGLLRREERPPRNDIENSVAQALDLCLACKGCKAECPSGVDMAKLKYEFENEYYKTHRRQLHDYVFGYFHLTAALAASIAPLSNALVEMSIFKQLIGKMLGITPHRPFPKFSNRRAIVSATETRRRGERIIFLSDPFSRYVEPQVEQAALDVLHQCGYEVHILPIVGAGASLLAKGFIDAMRDYARRVLDALNQIDPGGEASVVGVEPPEVYTLKHDYLALLPEHREEIARRIEKTWLLDEFLLRSEQFNALRVAKLGQLSNHKNQSPTKIYFHPHCHQRAEELAPDGLPSGAYATIELLRACGYEVELLDTGCCGMAGSFGYEAEHYDLSMKIGELKLFPKIRELGIGNQEAAVVSTGAACRMQIEQGTGFQANHSILLVRAALNS